MLKRNLLNFRLKENYLGFGLFVAALIIIFYQLDAKELWTQENRWAGIVKEMFARADFFHPYLENKAYYDKPLLSYWFIVCIAKIYGTLNAYVLRLPSALAGLLALYCLYDLGVRIKNKALGMCAASLMLTTFYFIFWARTSSADMLNLFGSLLAVCWYVRHRHQPCFYSYAVFFIILAVTSLCKGLVGAVVPCLIVLTDIGLKKTWKEQVYTSLILAVMLGTLVYFIPFVLSNLDHHVAYGSSGLYDVYRENILRYFKPFDHVDPLYTYFIYLPIYLLPWTILFIPAFYSAIRQRTLLSSDTKLLFYSIIIIFLFFTLSGSRRGYYILPILPYCILFCADWLVSLELSLTHKKYLLGSIIGFYVILLAYFCGIQPWYYKHLRNQHVFSHYSLFL